MTSSILITGGLGYIGSHVAVELIANGFRVHILDNLSNSDLKQLGGIRTITGNTPALTFEKTDIRDVSAVKKAIQSHNITAVIHCAGSKSVSESPSTPLKCYQNNISATISLIQPMLESRLKTIVFSSSATVYGHPTIPAISETARTKPANPYRKTKLAVENMLNDLSDSDPEWRTLSLRYFNPAGSHESGLIGDKYDKHPNNLVPIICQVLNGMRSHLSVYGDDYKTSDGTGEQDYIHVTDLAKAHVRALAQLMGEQHEAPPCTINVGTGKCTSVLGVVRAFEHSCDLEIPSKIEPRRPGDIDKYFADPTLARNVLGWTAEKSLETMCIDTWRWANCNKRLD